MEKVCKMWTLCVYVSVCVSVKTDKISWLCLKAYWDGMSDMDPVCVATKMDSYSWGGGGGGDMLE